MRADEIDGRDRAILRALMSGGRLTNVALAERVHLSSSACLRRVRLLEESGLTAGYVMPLDPDFAGLSGAAFVSVALEQQGRATLDRFEQDERRLERHLFDIGVLVGHVGPSEFSDAYHIRIRGGSRARRETRRAAGSPRRPPRGSTR